MISNYKCENGEGKEKRKERKKQAARRVAVTR